MRLLLLILVCTTGALAQTPQNLPEAAANSQLPFFDSLSSGNEEVDSLVREAQTLFLSGQPIDARAKLLRAIQLDPKDHRAQMLLGSYYLGEVNHFPLAYKYIRSAERLFHEKYGSSEDNSLRRDAWRHEARLLFLLAESRLNLDNYQGAYETLETFGKHYWDDWYEGSLAWVLMKLKRVDEAIAVAQRGLLRGADPTRTYNILGILFSLKDNRPLALQAFSRAIKAELALGGKGQVATPLNNAGEVYREMFHDDLAEASWLKAVQMVDGCEHVLPSLNLAILYIDELRLFQAERVLSDFEACFSAHELKEDSEHRALLALARGRIALRRGDIEQGVALITQAAEQEQWFGKIGTDVDDMRFASATALGIALRARAHAYNDHFSPSLWSTVRSEANMVLDRVRSQWHLRRAREIALSRLSNFEDLYIRNTDAMLEYPTLGGLMQGLPTSSLKKRLERMKSSDNRTRAHGYYDLYLAQNLLYSGYPEKARDLVRPLLLSGIPNSFRSFDRLARAEALAMLVHAELNSRWFWQRNITSEPIRPLIEELFELLPSHLRAHDLLLPVRVSTTESELNSLIGPLDGTRFAFSNDPNLKYVLTAETNPDNSIVVTLKDQSGRAFAIFKGERPTDSESRAKFLNGLISKIFRHSVDPPPEPMPDLEILPEALRR